MLKFTFKYLIFATTCFGTPGPSSDSLCRAWRNTPKTLRKCKTPSRSGKTTPKVGKLLADWENRSKIDRCEERDYIPGHYSGETRVRHRC